MERIELRDANEVFRQHQRPLGKLHAHEVAVGIARGCDRALAGAAVASRPRLACLDDGCWRPIPRVARESGFRRVVWHKKADVVPFELVRAGWDRMPNGCLPVDLGDGSTLWLMVLRGQE